MNGIDNIKNKILSEAEAAAESTLAEAQKKAGSRAAEAAEALAKEKSLLLEKGERAAKLAAERIVSSASKEQRKNVLAVKQDLIGEVFSQAKEELQKLSGGDYKNLLVKLLENNIDSGTEEVLFPAGDSAIARDVVQEVNEKTGKALRVSEKNAPFEKGVLLRDGDTEVNLSLANVADSMTEELTPQVARLLFD